MPSQIKHARTPILIVGGGPVGSLLALSLSHFDQPCTLVEASLTTTPWPKMEQINGRTMEVLRILGLAEKLRNTKGVPKTDAPWTVLHYTGLGDPEPEFSRVDPHLSLVEERALDQQQNNGTRTSEHHQRCVLDIFEVFLKTEIIQNKNVNPHYGMKYLSHTENDNGVVTICIDKDGNEHQFRSDYIIGCDGAGSRVRRETGIKLKGGPINLGAYLVHFRSKELLELERTKIGRFWHINVHGSGVVLDQDELGTFTAHNFGPHVLQEDVTKYDPREVVFRVLGGVFGKPFRFHIDEIIVHSAWRPNFAVAESFISEKGHVLLAGDSAHRQPPHGGLGFNAGAHEQFDLAWKLTAAVQGYGRPNLLRSYALERKRISLQNLIHATYLVGPYTDFTIQLLTAGPQILDPGNAERQKLAALAPGITIERAADGVEIDRRHDYSFTIVRDVDGSQSPPWHVEKYQPSTAPGSRVPHVWLKDKIGETTTIDLICHGLTLVCFEPFQRSDSDRVKDLFISIAKSREIPLKVSVLKDEAHVRSIWEDRDMVLVRPDAYSVWRSPNASHQSSTSQIDVENILDVVLGVKEADGWKSFSTEPTVDELAAIFAEKLQILGVEDTEGGMGAVQFVAGFQVEVGF